MIGFETPKGSEKLEVDQVLVSVGRRPVIADCGFAEAGVAVSDRGFVQVDPTTLATSRPGVYAVGDVIDTPGLAHVAYAEAIVAIGSILGERPVPVDYGKVPWIVYTHPEVSWVGMTEAEARAAGHDVVVHRGHFAGNGRAMIVGSTDGIVKVIAQRDGPLLGVHHGRPLGQRIAGGKLPGRQLAGHAGRRGPLHPPAPEPVGGDRRDHARAHRPLPARLTRHG